MSAVIAIAGMNAVAAGCGSSGAKPATHGAVTHSPTTTPPAAAHTFASRRYGFRVTLTRNWSETDARVEWNGKRLQGLASPAFANFDDPATSRTLVAAAAPVAGRVKLAEWRAAMVRAASAFCAESSSTEPTTLDGEPALAWTARCSDGYNVNKLAALYRRHGYIILLASQTSTDDAADRRIFESVRGSFRFTVGSRRSAGE